MENSRIKLNNVRLSFPSLFQRAKFEGKECKFEATFLIPKSDKKLKKQLDLMIESAIKEAKVKKVAPDKICLKDGDNSEYDGYEGHWSLKAGHKNRPKIIGKSREQLSEDDNVIYAGCRVNAIIDFWVQDNQYGKRVNANLYGVQFAGDDEPFGQSVIDVTDEFDDIEDDESDKDVFGDNDEDEDDI